MKFARTSTILSLGLMFGVGLVVSGLTKPSIVVGAIDFGGAFDPSMFVVVLMAVGIYMPARLFILRRRAPLMATKFPGTPPRALDARLLVGASIFGLGWGLCGNCPGQAVTAFLGSTKTMIFIASVLAGMALLRAFDTAACRAPAREAAPSRG